MRRKWLFVLFILSMGCEPVASVAPAQAEPAAEAPAAPRAQWALEEAFPALRWSAPVDLQSDGDLLYVVEQGGLIKVFQERAEVKEAAVFLDLRAQVQSGGERGLLGLAFARDYARSGEFYVNYTSRDKGSTVVAAFRRAGPAGSLSADLASARVLLEIEQPYANHNGGQLAVGPDGMLYVAVGDGGAAGDPHDHGQRRETLLGSVLRIDPRGKTGALPYGIPADNPFRGNGEGWREEIWAWGLRNPWRISFDPVTGWLWAGDVGQNQLEEIDIIRRGGNYGWRRWEGGRCYEPEGCAQAAPAEPPVHTYRREEGQSVTGGVVARGQRLEALRGAYVFADFASGTIWALWVDEKGKKIRHEALIERSGANISSFGVGARGELYLCDYNGKIFRLALKG